MRGRQQLEWTVCWHDTASATGTRPTLRQTSARPRNTTSAMKFMLRSRETDFTGPDRRRREYL